MGDANRAVFRDAREKERYVRGMFDAIAPRYDLLNRVMSFRMDQRWRKRAVDALAPRAGGRYLDVGTGTGDLLLALSEREPGARGIGVDLAGRMLPLARGKGVLDVAQANGLALPFNDASFDGAANAFVLRNVRDLDAFFREMRRVLKPGAPLVSLEISRPEGRVFGPLYRAYFYHVMPQVGRRLSGDPEAYRYLADSVKIVPTGDALAQRARAAGFGDARVERLMRGALAMVVAR